MTAKGVPYLDLTLADPDGEINAKLWDYKEELHGEFAANDLIKVRGTIQPFNDSQQLRIERIRKVTEADGVRIEDFVPSAGFSGEAMFNELMKVAGNFKDEELKTLVTALLNEYKDKLLYWPAAFRLHHAIRGGLLYHTLSILRMAQGVADIYPFIDSDLLFAGVILHDIAKTEEFDVAQTGIASGYTTDGNLIGHLVRGAMAVDRCGRKLGISENVLMLVEHMIISHHASRSSARQCARCSSRRRYSPRSTRSTRRYMRSSRRAGMFSPANSLPASGRSTTASSITMTATTPISRRS